MPCPTCTPYAVSPSGLSSALPARCSACGQIVYLLAGVERRTMMDPVATAVPATSTGDGRVR